MFLPFAGAISVRSDNRHMGTRSTTYRVINAILWLYLWLSDVMHPVITTGDFWSEKFQQVFHLNRNFDDPVRLLAQSTLLVVFWFAIDSWLRWKFRRVEPSEKETDEWTDADKATFKALMERGDPRSETK
jgi:hypothetical protein